MALDPKHYYATLGVEPGCSDEEIRAAFRRRAKELHPDAATGSVSGFIRLKRAYDVLADPGRRARYDLAGVPPGPAFAEPRPPPLRPVRHRRVPYLRYAAAFVFMAAISIGGVEWMISAGSEAPSVATPPVQSLLTPGASAHPEAASHHAPALWELNDPHPAAPAGHSAPQ